MSYGKAVAGVASAAIMATGLFAALSQLQIAPAIVNGLFYAVLAIVVGSAIIAIGGGGIAPMRRRWDAVLDRYDQEKQRVAAEGQGAGERIQERYEQRRRQVQESTSPARGDNPGSRPAR